MTISWTLGLQLTWILFQGLDNTKLIKLLEFFEIFQFMKLDLKKRQKEHSQAYVIVQKVHFQTGL